MHDRMGQALSMQACFPLPAHGVQVVLRDLTAQKKQALWLSTLLDNMDDGIIAMDTDRLLTYMNQQAERILNWKLEELHGKNVHEHIHHHRPDGAPLSLEDCPIYDAVAQGTYPPAMKCFPQGWQHGGGAGQQHPAAGRPAGGQCHHLCRCQRHAPARTEMLQATAEAAARQERIPGHHEP
jgi:hypothetical protein